MTETEIAYLAGFFDGEGCVSILLGEKNTHNACIRISQKDPTTLYWIVERLGYGSVRSHIRKLNGKSFLLHKISISRREDIWKFCSLILPYSRDKKDQIKLMLEYLALPLNSGIARLKIAQKIRDLKSYSKEVEDGLLSMS